METVTSRPSGATILAFGWVVVLGGGNFLAVRASNLELPPFFGAGLRFGLAAVLFVAIVLMLRLPWPRGRQLLHTAVFGLLAFALFYALMYWALVRVTASVATIVLAAVPLMTVLLSALQGLERLRLRSAIGALLALAGILWMTFGPQAISVPLSALAAMLGASVCAGQSMIAGKRVSGNHPAVTNAVGMAVGATLLFGISALVGEAWALPSEPEAILAVGYLVTLGSVGLFVLVLLVVRRWTASATSYAFVLFPVSTMALEAWLFREPVTAQAAVGAALVMAGVWFGALSPGARASSPPVETVGGADPAAAAP